jgi:hypothetical protein
MPLSLCLNPWPPPSQQLSPVSQQEEPQLTGATGVQQVGAQVASQPQLLPR